MTAFWASFLITVALLAGAAWTGLRRRRRRHFVVAPLAIVALAVTVVLTERLLRAVKFPPDEMAIHLAIAKTGAALVVPVVVTGVLSVWRPRWKRLHLGSVALFLLVVLAATGTGIWVFSLSTAAG